jgi:hypothetical protein
VLGNIPSAVARRHASWRPDAHPRKKAHDVLKEAGSSPDVGRSSGSSFLPDLTKGRKEARRLTGKSYVPVRLNVARM